MQHINIKNSKYTSCYIILILECLEVPFKQLSLNKLKAKYHQCSGKTKLMIFSFFIIVFKKIIQFIMEYNNQNRNNQEILLYLRKKIYYLKSHFNFFEFISLYSKL